LGISSGYPTPFNNCPEAFQQPLGIFQQLSYTLFGVPTPVQQPLRAFPSGYQPKSGNFQPFSLKGHVSVNIYLKAEGAFEN
jgi:hypothetical protein